MSFAIITDSAANLTNELIDKHEIGIVSLEFLVEAKPYRSYIKGEKNDLKKFYDMMRNKEHITTSAVNQQTWMDGIEPALKSGKDALVIAFSSGLSVTAQQAKMACEALSEKYPERKIFCVDSLCAAMGQGMYVMYAVQKRAEGLTIEQTAAWLEENKLKMAHWFTVETLTYLKRGGRVSGATAVIGNLMSIKPVMHVDNEGKLIAVHKVRGRKASLDALVERMQSTAIEPEKQVIYISHGDCIEDAEYVAEQCREKMHVKDVIINVLDPVIGAHAGPGTMALFFVGTER